jgi:hypothetical protein
VVFDISFAFRLMIYMVLGIQHIWALHMIKFMCSDVMWLYITLIVLIGYIDILLIRCICIININYFIIIIVCL